MMKLYSLKSTIEYLNNRYSSCINKLHDIRNSTDDTSDGLFIYKQANRIETDLDDCKNTLDDLKNEMVEHIEELNYEIDNLKHKIYDLENKQ